jgi:1-acyl-sn-glycerol-3-phosphate acyltransferase
VPDDTDDPRLARSALLCALAAPYVRRYFRRHFHAVRMARDGFPPEAHGRPLIICSNHPSWWEPLLFALLTSLLFPGRAGDGPMDAAELDRYGVLRKIGVFGIEPHGRRGAARFLRTCRTLLQDPATLLWVTAEGAFTDPRCRPVRLRPGTAHLATDAPVVPLAIEYVFWNERKPEALLRFGRPLMADTNDSIHARIARLESLLQETMDRLAADSMTRDPARFVTLLSSATGVGGPYDLWRRGRAWAAGQRFESAHQP